MIDKRIVLVVGAGGSVPYGFPTGDGLKWKLCDELRPVETRADSESAQGGLFDTLLSEGFSSEKMTALGSRLRKSGWSSIDEFLAEHEELQEVGKAAIAGLIISSEDLDLLSEPHDAMGQRLGNWYQQFFKAVYTPFEDIQKNKVTILTYNYDTSLETYLQTTMSASYSRSPDEIEAALNHVRIVHLHGHLANHVYGSGVNSTSLRAYAQTMHIVTDEIDDNPQFQQAADSLWEANEIFFIGFGYDPKNLSRLPIESKYPFNSSGGLTGRSRPRLDIFGTAFDLAPARRTQVQDYFSSHGFRINLGQGNEDAYQYLRNTQRFGDR